MNFCLTEKILIMKDKLDKLQYLDITEKLELIYMWVKQGVITKSGFKELIFLYF